MKVIGEVRSLGSSIMIQADNLMDSIDDGKYTIEFRKYRKGRSLDQNAYFWKLVAEIAKKEDGDLKNKDDLYSHLLMMSGAKYEVVYLEEEALESLKRFEVIRHCKIVKRQVIGNKAMVMAFLFYGSSKFDTKEMSDLIDTTLRYAAEVGVDNVDSYWKELLNDN